MTVAGVIEVRVTAIYTRDGKFISRKMEAVNGEELPANPVIVPSREVIEIIGKGFMKYIEREGLKRNQGTAEDAQKMGSV